MERIAITVRQTVGPALGADITAASLERIAITVRETVGPAPGVDITAASLERIVITVRETVDHAIRQPPLRPQRGASRGLTTAQT
jgi:hypothetical protein